MRLLGNDVTQFNIGDKVSAWIRALPERMRKGKPLFEDAWVNHFGTELIHGKPTQVFFLKNVRGELFDRYFHAPGLKLLSEAEPFAIPPSNRGPLWASWYGPKSDLLVWWKLNPNGHYSMSLRICENVAGVTQIFSGESLKALAWSTWVKENECEPVQGCKYGKYKSIVGPTTS